MRRAIVVQADYRFMSAVVDTDTARLLREGDTVRVVRELRVGRKGVVKAGETAKVAAVYPGGHVEIEFMRPVPSLYEWRNCMILAPFDTDDWNAGLALVSVLEAKELAA